MLHQKFKLVKNEGSLNDVVCALVGGANTTPFLSSVVCQFSTGMKSVGKKVWRIPNPARIPPQTPPAGGTGAEAGRIHTPSQMFRPAESILVFRVFRKMGSDFFKQTPPNLICRRSCLGASPLGIGFRQEIPGGFEFRQKNSRRNSSVPKRSLDCAKGTRADE
jgi:hypothetical protein